MDNVAFKRRCRPVSREVGSGQCAAFPSPVSPATSFVVDVADGGQEAKRLSSAALDQAGVCPIELADVVPDGLSGLFLSIKTPTGSSLAHRGTGP